MATVDGLTKTRMLAIEAESITAARLDPITFHLIFTTHGGTDIDVGSVRGVQGAQGIQGVPGGGTLSHSVSWKIAGAPVVGGPQAPYPPELPIRIPAGQSATVISVVATPWGAWTTRPKYKIQRYTAATGAWTDLIGTTAAPLDPGAAIPGAEIVPGGGNVALANGDGLGLVILDAGVPNGAGPWAFTVEVNVDHIASAAI